MSIGSSNPLSNNNYLQSILTSALQSTGLTTNSTNNSLSTSASSSVSQSPDNSRLSPFAQVMSELQQLQQSDPSKYQQLTSQIATNLQTASQTAAAAGNTTAATQLNQLASDFSSASKNGQLPNVQSLGHPTRVTIRLCSPGWWWVLAILRASGYCPRFWRSLAAGWPES